MEKSLQLVPVKQPEKQAGVPWRPTVEREPELNPFANLVDKLTGIRPPTVH